MAEVMKLDGDYKIDTHDCHEITLYLEGEFGTGSIELFALGGGVLSQVYDGGPITGETVDSFNKPARRIVIAGRMEELTLRLSGASGQTNIRAAVL